MRLYSRDELARLKVDQAAGGRRRESTWPVCSGCCRSRKSSQRIRPLSHGRPRRTPCRCAMRAGCRRSSTTPDLRIAGARLANGFQGLLLHARRREDGDGEGDQAGVSQAGAEAPSRRQSRATSPPSRGSRRSTRRTKCSAIRPSARSTTSSAQTGARTNRVLRADKRTAAARARDARGMSTRAAPARRVAAFAR